MKQRFAFMREDCIEQLKQHNIPVYKEVYGAYHQKLYFFVLKHTQSAFLAEETVQLSFLQLWEKPERLSNEIELPIQLFRIARSIMIDLLRKEATRQHHLLQAGHESFSSPHMRQAETKQDLQRVYQVIEGMAPVRKKVFTLSRLEGQSHVQIAEQLSISTKTVENHMTRAIRQLRKSLSSWLFL